MNREKCRTFLHSLLQHPGPPSGNHSIHFTQRINRCVQLTKIHGFNKSGFLLEHNLSTCIFNSCHNLPREDAMLLRLLGSFRVNIFPSHRRDVSLNNCRSSVLDNQDPSVIGVGNNLSLSLLRAPKLSSYFDYLLYFVAANCPISLICGSLGLLSASIPHPKLLYGRRRPGGGLLPRLFMTPKCLNLALYPFSSTFVKKGNFVFLRFMNKL